MIYVLISQWVWRTSTDVRLTDYERLYCAQSCHSNENPFTEVSYLAGEKNQIRMLKWFLIFNLIEHPYLAEDCPAPGVGVGVEGVGVGVGVGLNRKKGNKACESCRSRARSSSCTQTDGQTETQKQ